MDEVAGITSVFSFTSEIGPDSVTILSTYKCTAACTSCCFECSPKLEGRLEESEILAVVDRVKTDFPSCRLIVFSGGECFLLGRTLANAVRRVTERGLASRCVTNGYWATSMSAALKRLEPLRAAGLTEINFSTGDEHQQFVPVERIVNGAKAAVSLGITTLIVVEGSLESKFTVQDLLSMPDVKSLMHDHPREFMVITNVWMPFQEMVPVTQSESIANRAARREGCDNIFDNFVILPDRQVASCCGLTMEHIPDMKLGDIHHFDLQSLYASQSTDLVKMWIWLDGPGFILNEVLKDRNAPANVRLGPHMCESCAMLYLNHTVREIVRQYAEERANDILERFALKWLLRCEAARVRGSNLIEP